MDGSLEKIGQTTPVRPPAPRRERPRREGEPVFRLPHEGAEGARPDDEPSPPRIDEARPVAPPDEDEPGVRLDISG